MLYPSDLATLARADIEAATLSQAGSVYLGDGTVLARVLTRYKMLLHTHDRGFAAHVMLDGFWEIWLTQFFARTLKPGMQVMDVGANYGYHTLLFADIVSTHGKVIAVEPNPAAAGLLRQSVLLNGFAGHTHIVEAALGASPDSTAHLIVPQSEPKNAHVSDSSLDGALVVPSTNIDRLVETFGRFDFIKIDAEGAEQNIIEGMRQLLHEAPPALVLEFNAARCADPAILLQELRDVYREIRTIDFSGIDQVVSIETLLTTAIGEDWMLYFCLPTRSLDLTSPT